MNRSNKVRRLVTASMIAAIYTVLSLSLGALSFGAGGAVQLRVAEALTLLPLFSLPAVWGVTLGCALTNAIGLAMGMNLAGVLDIPLGAIATLAAALLTRALGRFRLRGVPYLAWLPPVICNAVIVGGEITWVLTGTLHTPVLWLNMGYVALGEALACGLLGLPLVGMLERSGLAARLFSDAPREKLPRP